MMSRGNIPCNHHPPKCLHHISGSCFNLKVFKVFEDLTSGDNFPNNLGPRYLKECLPHVTVLYLGTEKSGCLKK